MIRIARTTTRDPDFAMLVAELDRELFQEFRELQATYAVHNVLAADTAVVVYAGAAPVGCGAFKPFDASAVELKRMFVAPAHRRGGVGRAIVDALETWARELGYAAAVLETGTRLTAAIGLYGSLGYARIDNYGPYVGLEASVCMRKPL